MYRAPAPSYDMSHMSLIIAEVLSLIASGGMALDKNPNTSRTGC